MISIFAPAGIGEVTPATDLAAEICAAVAADPAGPLASGDIVVVTSKVVSKVESRRRPAAQRDVIIDEESVGTVARRGPTKIVRTGHGLVLAAAGVDNSNVDPQTVLLLPADPDASAVGLRDQLQRLTGATVGVVISDTAGRAWRIGQTDQAIGAPGDRVIERYAGRTDSYGNELQVTAMAIADELAAAADLVKSKLSDRPVAVIRGLAHQLCEDAEPAASPDGAAETHATVLVRDERQDLFRFGSRESVIAAVLQATDQQDRYEAVLQLEDADLVESVVAGTEGTDREAELLRRVLRAALTW
jgi:coenzyme F420-0:L-glutamate ligase/coenzyme F420-1:gamma-L-glutamate ligase